jgi:hypothetical protein
VHKDNNKSSKYYHQAAILYAKHREQTCKKHVNCQQKRILSEMPDAFLQKVELL